MLFDIRKNIFACLFSIHNALSLSSDHTNVQLSRKKVFLLGSYFSVHVSFLSFPGWWEKYLSKCSPLKHTCSWRDKLMNRQAKIFLCKKKYFYASGNVLMLCQMVLLPNINFLTSKQNKTKNWSKDVEAVGWYCYF